MVNLGELFFSIVCKDEASGEVQSTASKIASASTAIGGAMTAVGGAATLLIDSNRQMDASFKTTALSMGAPADSVKELARSLQSVDSPIEEVAATLDVLARAGVTNTDSMGNIASAFDTLADATGNNADVMADAMVPAFNALGIPLDAAPDKIDGLATMFRKSNTDLGDFSKVMTKLGPDLGAMGVGLEDVEAIMMIFAERGITGKAATAELSKAVKDSDGSLAKFYDSLNMGDLELEKYGNLIIDSAGAADEFAEAQNSSLGVMDKVGFELTKLKQSAGDMLAPFEGVASAFLGLGPILMGIGPIITTLSGIGGFAGISAAVGGLGATIAGFIPVLLGFLAPFALPIAIAVAIGAALYLLNERFDLVGKAVAILTDVWEGYLLPALEVVWDLLVAFGEWLVGIFLDRFNTLKDGILAAWEFICSIFGGGGGPDIVAILQGVWDAVIGAATAAWNAFSSAVGAIINTFITGIQIVWDAYRAWLELLWNTILTVATTIWNLFASGITTIINLFITGIQIIWDAYRAYLETLWNTILTVATTIWNLFASGITTIINTFISGIQIVWDAYRAYLETLWNTIKTVAETAWNLIKTTITGIVDALKAAVETALNLLKTAIDTIWSNIKGGAEAGWNNIKSAVAGAVGGVVDAVKGPIGGLVSWAQGVWDDICGIFAQPVPTPSTGGAGTTSNGTRVDDHAESGDQGSWVGDHYVSPGATGYWDDGEWVSLHSGGTYRAANGASEGLAMLLTGERVLSRGETADLGTLMRMVADLTSSGGGGGDIHVHGDVNLSADYPYDKWRDDVARWGGLRTQRGMLGV